MLSAVKKPSVGSAISVLCLFMFVLLSGNAEIAGEHVTRGMRICAETLIPSLFPFMVISELLVRSGACEPISRLMKKPMHSLFGVSGECATALLLGIICGFPVGAKTAAALYSRGSISRQDCESLLGFCNFPSAPFMIFAVGHGMFGSRKIGIFLYCLNLFSGLICGIVFRTKTDNKDIVKTKYPVGVKDSISSIFSSSVVSAAYSVISVCAFVTFFTCAIGTFSSILGTEFPSPFRAILFSFFELTSGCAACASVGNTRLALILAAAASGWSGLSVFLQICSLTRTEGTEISLAPYLKSKLLSAVLTATGAALFTYLFPSLTEEASSVKDAFSAVISYPTNFTVGANVIFVFASIICLYKLLDIKRKI